MSKLLFSLRGVPEDEAEEIKNLLTDNSINYYETSAGNWGISMPALWIKNEEQLAEAGKLLTDYHLQRAITQRSLYEQLKKEGKHKSFWDIFIANPMQFFIYIIAIFFVLYACIKLIFEFGL